MSVPCIVDCRLTVLTQRGEISLVDKVKKEATATPTTPAKGKKQARIKALSAKVKRDEHLEVNNGDKTVIAQPDFAALDLH